MKKVKPKKCRQCSSEFIPFNSLNKYCGYDCRIKAKKATKKRNWDSASCEKIKGRKNPNYKTGLRTGNKQYKANTKFIKNCKILDKKLIDNVGYLYCESCRTTNTLRREHHHIIFRSEKPKHPHLHDIDNILLVCIQCHNEYHKHKAKRNELVKKRKLYLKFGNDVLNK